MKKILPFLFLSLILSGSLAFGASITDLTGYTGKIGQEDINLGTGETSDTFAVPTYSGGTTTLTKFPNPNAGAHSKIKNIWYVNNAVTIVDHGTALGADYAAGNLKKILDLVGATTQTIELPGNTTYTITTDLTIPDNVTLRFQRGAVLAGTGNLTFSGVLSIEAGDFQIFNNSGNITFATGSVMRSKWFPNITTAIVKIGAVQARLIVSGGDHVLTNNTTIPATLGLLTKKDSTITKASSYVLTINGPFECGLHQAFVGFTGGSDLVFGPGTTDFVRPEWFGAKADGVTDSSPGITAAIKTLFQSRMSTLRLGTGNYYVDSPVLINVDLVTPYNYVALRLSGSGSPLTIQDRPGWANSRSTVMTGKDGIASIFTITKTDLLTYGGFSFECDHINFLSGPGPTAAITNLVGGSPARPFIVRNCGFFGFTKAILSDISQTGGLNTGISHLSIKENVFITGTYALYATGGQAAILNLDFSNNLAEGGGKIYASENALSGPIRICDNNFEGQSNAIDIYGMLCPGSEIRGNYFEANTGYLMNLRFTQRASSVVLAGNYYTGSPTARINLYNCAVTVHDDLHSVIVSASLLYRNSVINKNALYLDTTGKAEAANQVDLSTVSARDIVPTGIGGGLLSQSTSTYAATPLGTRRYAVVAPSSALLQQNNALAVGDYVVVTALVRNVEVAGLTGLNIWLNIYNDAEVFIARSEATFSALAESVGDWRIVNFAVRATATSTGHFHFNLATDTGRQFHLSDVYVYMGPALTNTDPYYIYLPRVGGAGVATMPASGSSVTVTHGLPYTPSLVTATAGGNIGSVWVTSITSSQFTINCSAAPGGNTSVYWKAD